MANDKTIKAFKVTISGSFRNSKKEAIDFNDITGYIPAVNKELAYAAVIRRYAMMWLSNSGKYKERAINLREVYIDRMEPVECEFSYIGKTIREMTQEELQDFAVAKDLRGVPLYKKGSARQAQIVAHALYSDRHLGIEVPYKEQGFNFADEPDYVADNQIEKSEYATISNDEMIGMEQKNTTSKKSSISREELENLAKRKHITFHPNISDAKLYDKVFSS